ncbi:electron transport complex subunit RsxB [Rhodoferax sp. U11-2br]|uniref:electron transport complex subunit RsxB n=1 Tax=Rhodoferax sp. U11-2br TaxID=2838878 RepID=UPI001BEBEA1D|nr:electron transport complex subunit RsxB [Rhodoferax sp. U11-2br]MBT3068226.1 electron transport complex subunit RsxB [Rhodoferax sp. U11-2br]
MTPLAQDILAALPQTQCTRCGYPDCAAYAQAVANSEADINQCPPGGQEGVARLAALTGQTAKPLNPVHGVEGPRNTVFIDEDWCIGCTLCIKACPVDAIVGANKLMHTVIEAHCTGCELCLPVCPVDCIRVENTSGTATGWAAWSQADADKARERYSFHSYRLKQDEGLNEKELEITDQENRTHPAPASEPVVPDKKRAVIEAALARARAKREASPAP